MSTSRRGTRTGSGRRPGVYPGLAALLWTVRDSLESVLYRLVVVRLVLTDGSARWLARADAELRAALEELRAVEVLRASEVDALVPAPRKPERASLGALMKSAPAPWPRVFADHRDALRVLLGEIDAAIAETGRILQAAASGPSAAAGTVTRTEPDAALAAAYRSALATLETAPQLSLREFLGSC